MTRSASPATTLTRRPSPATSALLFTNFARYGFDSTQISRPRGGNAPAIRIAE